MKKVKITVFGTTMSVASDALVVSVCRCRATPEAEDCGPSKTMKEEAEDLKSALLDKYGEVIEYTYVDVQSEEMKSYPQIEALRDTVILPLICLNGEPSYHGGFSADIISYEVGKLLA